MKKTIDFGGRAGRVGGWQAEESGTLCVPLEKSWLRLCIIFLNAGAYTWSQSCLNNILILVYFIHLMYLFF